MKKILMTVLLFVVTSNVFAIPTLIEASATGTTVKFATKLSEILHQFQPLDIPKYPIYVLYCLIQPN